MNRFEIFLKLFDFDIFWFVIVLCVENLYLALICSNRVKYALRVLCNENIVWIFEQGLNFW